MRAVPPSSLRAEGPQGGQPSSELWRNAKSTADHEHFLHWEVAFPGVWRQLAEHAAPRRFRRRDRQPALGPHQAPGSRVVGVCDPLPRRWRGRRPQRPGARGIARLRKQGSPLAAAFDAAKELAPTRSASSCAAPGTTLCSAAATSTSTRCSSSAPCASSSPTDSWACSRRRASTPTRPPPASSRPSLPVAACPAYSTSRTAASGPACHPSSRTFTPRFKFVALIFGGEQRQFEQTDCAFFLHDTATIADDPDRCFPLTAPADFMPASTPTPAPRPSSAPGAMPTSPVASTQRHPVLVDRSTGQERRAWPVRYHTMFHMANSSHLFHTAAGLEVKGFLSGSRQSLEARR